MSGLKRYIANFRKHSKNGPYDEIIEKEIVLSSDYDALLKERDEINNQWAKRNAGWIQENVRLSGEIQSLKQQLSESIPKIVYFNGWIIVKNGLGMEIDKPNIWKRTHERMDRNKTKKEKKMKEIERLDYMIPLGVFCIILALTLGVICR